MSRNFQVLPTSLPGPILLKRWKHEDTRGVFSRIYCKEQLKENEITMDISQINFSYTANPGAVRGMHFQKAPSADAKVVTCIRGKVWDVVIDIRKRSPSLLKWHGQILSASECSSLFIPEGFAHGFQTLSADCEMVYLHSESHSAECEGGIRFDDPRVAIQWPLEVSDLSARDRSHPVVSQAFLGIDV